MRQKIRLFYFTLYLFVTVTHTHKRLNLSTQCPQLSFISRVAERLYFFVATLKYNITHMKPWPIWYSLRSISNLNIHSPQNGIISFICILQSICSMQLILKIVLSFLRSNTPQSVEVSHSAFLRRNNFLGHTILSHHLALLIPSLLWEVPSCQITPPKHHMPANPSYLQEVVNLLHLLFWSIISWNTILLFLFVSSVNG